MPIVNTYCIEIYQHGDHFVVMKWSVISSMRGFHEFIEDYRTELFLANNDRIYAMDYYGGMESETISKVARHWYNRHRGDY